MRFFTDVFHIFKPSTFIDTYILKPFYKSKYIYICTYVYALSLYNLLSLPNFLFRRSAMIYKQLYFLLVDSYPTLILDSI